MFRHGSPAGADSLERTVGPDEVRPLLEFVKQRLPGLGPEVCAAVACMYTTTPDEHFLVGYPSGDQRVVVCSPCSGHGFKFVPVIGEVVADLVTGASTAFDISLFDPDRFCSPHNGAEPTGRRQSQ